jgi:hypothetical protein
MQPLVLFISVTMALALLLSACGQAERAAAPGAVTPPAATPPQIEIPGIPLPDDLQIVPPAPEVPGQFAGFSGAWIGSRDGVSHVLVVESVRPPLATVVYAHASAPHLGIHRARFFRESARFEGKELVLVLPNGAVMRYKAKAGEERIWRVHTGPRGARSESAMSPIKIR